MLSLSHTSYSSTSERVSTPHTYPITVITGLKGHIDNERNFLEHAPKETRVYLDTKKFRCVSHHTFDNVYKGVTRGAVVGGVVGGVVTLGQPVGIVSGALIGGWVGGAVGGVVGFRKGYEIYNSRVPALIKTNESYYLWRIDVLREKTSELFSQELSQSIHFEDLIDPYTLEIPHIPVKAPCGHTYDKANMELYIQNKRPGVPLCGKLIDIEFTKDDLVLDEDHLFRIIHKCAEIRNSLLEKSEPLSVRERKQLAMANIVGKESISICTQVATAKASVIFSSALETEAEVDINDLHGNLGEVFYHARLAKKLEPKESKEPK